MQTLRIQLATTITAAFVLGGCAAGADAGADVRAGPGDGQVIVDARNTTVTSATVYLVAQSGARMRVGSVNMGDRERFTVQNVDFGRYNLVADLGIDEIVSREFSMKSGDVVEWRLDLNQLNYVGEIQQR